MRKYILYRRFVRALILVYSNEFQAFVDGWTGKRTHIERMYVCVWRDVGMETVGDEVCQFRRVVNEQLNKNK